MTGDGRLVTAIVRGDYEVNETKLVNAVEGDRRASGPATVEEIKAAGMEPGYGSPIGAHDTVVVVDDLVAPLAEPRRRREPGRASTTATSTSGATSRPTSSPTSRTPRRAIPCPTCGEPVILRNGIEVGNIFKLGTKFTDAARRDLPRRGRRGAPDRHGLVRDRRRAERGLHRRGAPRREGHRLAGRGRAVRGPPRLDRRRPRSRASTEIAERLHAARAATPAREILWDDRDESPGVKFTDAELLGMPWILTVSPRSLAAGGVEVTERATGERSTRPIEDVEAMHRAAR